MFKKNYCGENVLLMLWCENQSHGRAEIAKVFGDDDDDDRLVRLI